MKHLKKIIPFVLAAMLAIAPCFMAFAEGGSGSSSGGGSSVAGHDGVIKITNAEIGKEYKIYKVFDATVSGTGDDKATSYTCSNVTLVNYIKNNCSTDPSKENYCPFKVVGDPVNGAWSIQHVNGTDTTAVSKGRGWLKNHLDLLGNPTATHTCTASDNGVVTFSGLDYGYYLMQPGEGATASVNNVTPTVEMVDKNPTGPNTPKKVASDHLVAVGDEVEYTISFNAVNYRTNSSLGDGVPDIKQIKEYKIVDTYEGQTFKDLKSVTVKWGDGAGESKVLAKDTDYTMTKSEESSTGGGTATFNIKWVNSAGSPLYKSPATVTIVYTTTMNVHALDNNKFYEENKADIDYKVVIDSKDTWEDLGEPDEKVWTTGISIRKTDADYTNATPGTSSTSGDNSGDNSGVNADGTLRGAEFILYKIDGEGAQTSGGDTSGYNSGDVSGGTDKLYYHWDAETGLTWVRDKSQATVEEADNQYGTCEFKGLHEGTYYMEEITPPKGYNKPSSPFEVVINGEPVNGENGKVIDVKITATVADEEAGPGTSGGKENRYITANIVNSKGKALPTTGGTGTLVLIIVGIIAFLGTAIVLVTKKRMYNQG